MSAVDTRRALVVALLAFAVTHGLYQTGRAFLHPKQGLDLAPEYVAGRMLTHQGDRRFYDHDVLAEHGRQLGLHGPLGPEDPIIEYAYPPWLPLLYAPLAQLPWEAARRIWFAVSLTAVLAAAALAAAAAAPSPASRRACAAGAIAVCCFYFPITYGLMAGQANELPLLGIAASLWFLRTGRPFLAGLVLAPAGLWKIFTGFPALFLLARREWKALGGLALGCATLFLLSLPIVGIGSWIDWLHTIPYRNTLTDVAPRNHSIAGAVILLFRANGLATPLVDAPGLVRPLTLALQGLAVLATLALLLPSARREDSRYCVQFAATLVLAVMLAPQSWEHYGVYLLPAFFACFIAAVAPDGGGDGPERATAGDDPESATLVARTAGIARGPGERPAWVALVVTSAALAVWGLLFQTKDDVFALGSGSRVLFIPAKLYASIALLGVCVALTIRGTWSRSRADPRPQ